jgi:hypothetical protein
MLHVLQAGLSVQRLAHEEEEMSDLPVKTVNLQLLFDSAVDFLYRQNEKCMMWNRTLRKATGCYQNALGQHCPVGHLLHQEILDSLVVNNELTVQLSWLPFFKETRKTKPVLCAFLEDLQKAHDRSVSRAGLLLDLDAIAEKYRLKTTCLEKWTDETWLKNPKPWVPVVEVANVPSDVVDSVFGKKP